MREMTMSGEVWIGYRPVDWEENKIKYVAPIHNERASTNEGYIGLENIESWTGKLLPSDSVATGESVAFQKNDVLFGKLRPYLAKSFLAKQSGCGSTELLVMRPDGISPEYLAYIMRSKTLVDCIDVSTYGAKMPRANGDFIKNLRVPLPPLSEQHTIVLYLDSKCSAIDEAIERHKKIIEKLEEYRTEVVTSEILGLHHNDVSETGIDWMSRMSASRKAWRLKYLVKEPLKYGANESGTTYDETLPRYIRITDITPEGRLKDTGKLSLTEEQASKYLLEDGTILFARSGATVGKTFLYREAYGRSAFAGYLISAVPDTEMMVPGWLKYYTESLPYKNWKDMIFTQATIQNIGADKYSELIVPICSIDEQMAVVSKLDEISTRIKLMIETQSCIIKRLEEYRKSIIYNAVTGKIDCREAVE